MPGPLQGIRVLEMAGLGPIPHAGMLLADLGADVVRVARPTGSAMAELAGDVDPVLRSRTHTRVDLKSPDGIRELGELIARADVLIEGFRPGVMERLGFGPDAVAELNPRLVYGRMTGWGREGPRSAEAGHDLNYLAVTGILHAIGHPGTPPPVPLTLLGDYAGGSLPLALGIVSALVERASSGRGQVVDMAMVDGIGMVAQKIWALRGVGRWSDERGANLLDGGAPFYATYRCADGRFVAIGAIERKFFAELVALLEIDPAPLADQYDPAGWAAWRDAIGEALASRPRDEWAARAAGTDACVTPVLTFAEALEDAHARERGAFVGTQTPLAAPTPQFSRSTLDAPTRPDEPGISPRAVAQRWA
ncbi:CaiB/BaiF CoA transferase family protein [Microbacterium sp. NPDC055910]|uniref:CaiB/BaiF CoA transferase family protein n=1 Tax=Microbacterium sp. NPDC055910 TaxID=3345659 RepID=UPI0035D539A7